MKTATFIWNVAVGVACELTLLYFLVKIHVIQFTL